MTVCMNVTSLILGNECKKCGYENFPHIYLMFLSLDTQMCVKQLVMQIKKTKTNLKPNVKSKLNLRS